MGPPQQLIQQDSVATVPFVIGVFFVSVKFHESLIMLPGNTDDEGTIFSFGNSNITYERFVEFEVGFLTDSTGLMINCMITSRSTGLPMRQTRP